MLTPTPGVTQTCHPSTKNKYSKVQRDLSSCNLAKGEKGHRKKEEYMLRSIEKNVLQSKSIEKRKRKHDPPPK
jgi:hypothetical protein